MPQTASGRPLCARLCPRAVLMPLRSMYLLCARPRLRLCRSRLGAAGEFAVPVEGARVPRIVGNAAEGGAVRLAAQAVVPEQHQPAATQKHVGELPVHTRLRKFQGVPRAARGGADEHAVQHAAPPEGGFLEVFQKLARKHRLEVRDEDIRAA